MATVALFHSVLGVRQGVLDAAERLRKDGHDVLVVDLLDGRTFDDYPPAMSFAEKEVGQAVLMQRAAKPSPSCPTASCPPASRSAVSWRCTSRRSARVSGVLLVA